MDKGAFRMQAANVYLDIGPKSEWLLDPTCPVPRVDIRRAGATRPVWRWRRVDLDAFLASRLVRPGEANPQDQ